jgi:hypothetical protein
MSSSFANTYNNLDLLIFDSIYGVIICKLCKYAVVPREITSHLRTHHRADGGLALHQIKAIHDQCLTYPSHPPVWIKEMPMPPYTPPVPFLHLYQGGFCCRLCPTTKSYVCLTESGITIHLKEKHKWSRRSGRPSAAEELSHSLSAVATFPIASQTFFRRNLFIRYFPVQPVSANAKLQDQDNEPSSKMQALSIPEQVEQQLDQKLAAANPATSSRPRQQHFSQISPWLDTNQWTRYLQGRDLLQAARLIQLPYPAAQQTASDMQPHSVEHLLTFLLEAFDRVIEQARNSLVQDRVNVFDQHRVNSFIPRRTSKQPLWHQLKEPTYRTYKKVWKQLLCFLYRMVWQKQAPVLHCCLTSAQSTALEAVLQAAANLAQQQESAPSEDTNREWYQEIDRACLLLCIALLDQPLFGNIYDSVVVGFLAVLGINSEGSYHEATAYTPHLPACEDGTALGRPACSLSSR